MGLSGKAHHLGTFDTLEEAIASQDKAKRQFEQSRDAKTVSKAESKGSYPGGQGCYFNWETTPK